MSLPLPQDSKILFITASPLDKPPVDYALEHTAIREAVQHRFELVTWLEARPEDLIAAIQEVKPAVVHFCGHGTGLPGLMFQQENGDAVLLTRNAMKALLEAEEVIAPVKLMVLNACFSVEQAKDICQKGPDVIAMKRDVREDVAVAFSDKYYRALAANLTTQGALPAAIGAMTAKGLPEADTPVFVPGRNRATAVHDSVSASNISEGLPVERLEELTAEIIKLECLQSVVGWAGLADCLPFFEWNNEGTTSDLEYARRLVKSCAGDPTGFDSLLGVLERMGNCDLKPLYALLEAPLVETHVTYPEVAELRALLEQGKPVKDAEAVVMFQRLFPTMPVAKNLESGRKFMSFISLLAKNYHDRRDKGPVFAYLESCRAQLEPKVQGLLSAWEKKVGGRLKLDLPAIRAAAEEKAGPFAPGVTVLPMPVLQIKVEPVMEERDASRTQVIRYRLTAWLWREEKEAGLLQGVPEGLHAAEELPNRFNTVVNAALEVLDDLAHMRIEVILPHELLELPLDDVLFPDGPDDIAAGCFWPLVVRSYDRLYDERRYRIPKNRWQKKWQRLHAADEGAFPGGIKWAEGGAAYDGLFFEDLEHEDSLAFVAFTLLPQDCPECTTSAHVLGKLLKSGIGAAVWVRDHDHPPAESKSVIEQKLLHGRPHTWPEKIKPLRKACSSAAPLMKCKGLTFFWDDAHRIPPAPVRLDAPAQSPAISL